MMLYHVPDLDKGLSEVQRVLKKGGSFYCATFGQHGIVEYMTDLLQPYDIKDKTDQSFTLQNGDYVLRNYFSTIERLDYPDELRVTNLDDIIDYVYSLSNMININHIERNEFKQILQKKMVNGVLHVPKEYGMFLCKK